MQNRSDRESYPRTRQLLYVKQEQRRDEQKRGIADIISLDVKMSDHISGKPDVENTERKSGKENGKKNIGPTFPDTFIIEQKNNKDPEDNAAVD